MSGLSLPVSRPTGRALLVAGAGNRTRPLEILHDLGYGATEVDDPYAAMTELCRRPLVYRAVILSLASLYREELAIIPAIKARYPHVELWLTHTDGRQAAMAESMRLGADGLLAEDGLHRVAGPPSGSPAPPSQTIAPTVSWADPNALAPAEPAHAPELIDDLAHDSDPAGPILSADELRALLHEQSSVPPEE